MNLFQLSPLEKRNMKRNFKQLTNQRVLEISYLIEDEDYNQFDSGGNTNWSDYSAYKCGIQEVDEINISRYDYGDVEEGDLLIYLPYNTELPDESKYRIKYNDVIYTSTGGYATKEDMSGEILYYILIGRR